MITIYINECECGNTGQQIRKVKKYARKNLEDVQVKNARYDKDVATTHLKLLWEELGIKGSYVPIVLHNGTVTKLKEWNK